MFYELSVRSFSSQFFCSQLKKVSRLEKRLGVGSFGTVYLARDTALNTLVAIKHTKFLKGETDRELESLTALVSQPNVLQLECTQVLYTSLTKSSI